MDAPIMLTALNTNPWDGFIFPNDNQQVNIRTGHIDHRNRTAMNADDRKELISHLWTQQVKIYITKGHRDPWQYRKQNGKFLRRSKRKVGIKSCNININR